MSGLVLPRDPRFELELATIAARSVGVPEHVARSLSAYANSRTLPGPVLLGPGRDMEDEFRQELGDGYNYAVWDIRQNYQAFLAGDAAATDRYERMMRSFARVTQAWQELHTRAV